MAKLYVGSTLVASDTIDATAVTSGILDVARVPEITNSRLPIVNRKAVVTGNTDATLTLNFALGDEIIRSTRAGTLTFAGSNYTAGVSKTVVWNGGASNRTVSFPAGWVFVSFKPTSLPANKRGVLTVTSHGTAEADCTAAWAAQG